MTKWQVAALVFGGQLLATVAADAHHSYADYDRTRTVEIEGKLISLAWENPHSHFRVEVADAGHGVVTWIVEGGSLNNLRRAKAPLELYKVGDTVKVAGWPAKRDPARLYGTNLLSADGKELVMFGAAKPRWESTAFGLSAADSPLYVGGSKSATDSMFRVWSSNFRDPDAGPDSLFKRTPLPFTAAAQKTAALNRGKNITTGCRPKGMPEIMAQPLPMEVVDQGDTISVRLEEYDTVRTIQMRPATPAVAPAPSLLGYSRGHWEGKTLVVETTGLSARYLDHDGDPMGPATRLTERFTVNADGSRLNYVLTITDPDTLTAPAELKRSWIWKPGEHVMPFNCTEPDFSR
jgi:Family of unknown function (DUF6152)